MTALPADLCRIPSVAEFYAKLDAMDKAIADELDAQHRLMTAIRADMAKLQTTLDALAAHGRIHP